MEKEKSKLQHILKSVFLQKARGVDRKKRWVTYPPRVVDGVVYRRCIVCDQWKEVSKFWMGKFGNYKRGRMCKWCYKKSLVKKKARRLVNAAVRSGKLIKPENCSYCNKHCWGPRLEGHHEDYSKPLEVEWLCRRCHDKKDRGLI